MRHRGFTLIEVLVTIAIIGLLLALLLPAVNYARESVRRTQCLANLHQLGIANEGYHDTHGCYPPGRWPNFDPRVRGDNYPCTALLYDKSPFVLVLPFAEQQTIYESVNQQTASSGPENFTLASRLVPLMRCPSDSGESLRAVSFTRFAIPPTQPLQAAYLVARSNYLSNFGTLRVLGGPAFGANCSPNPLSVQELDGIFHDRFPIRNRDVQDGLSKTLFFTERATLALDSDRDPLSEDSRYGWWFVGNIADTLGTAACPPNAKGGSSLRRGMTASSGHTGGVHAAFGDASVRFIGETIDSWADDGGDGPAGATFDGRAWSNVPPRRLWQALWTRAGKEALGADF